MPVDSEREDVVRAHRWIRLFPGRKLCGHDEHGVYWDNEKGSTFLVVWKDVDDDLLSDQTSGAMPT